MAIRALAYWRLFRSELSLHDLNQCPSESVIRSWVKKFESTGLTLNQKPAGRPRSIRTEETVSEVATSVRRDPQLSTQKRSTVSRTNYIKNISKAYFGKRS